VSGRDDAAPDTALRRQPWGPDGRRAHGRHRAGRDAL